jgi:ATP-dependent exoDNAse (exonuclease V) beta subunit
MAFVVYKASAGSGKTFSLVREYLKIILEEPSAYRNILAITFTNKVANEMKERVLAALTALSKGEGPEGEKTRRLLLPMLTEATGMPETEIRLKAAQALEMILHNYADFAIGTIDSFSHRIIRTFAHDFGLPVNFQIELDSDELLSTAVDLLLDRVGEDQDLTKLLVRFLETRMDEERGWNIDLILTRFAKNLLDDEGEEYIRRLRNVSLEDFFGISRRIYQQIGVFEKKIREIATEATDLVQSVNLSHQAFFHGSTGILKYFENLAMGRFDKTAPNSYVRTTVEEDKWYSGKATAEEQSKIDSVKSRLLDLYERIQVEADASLPGYNLMKCLAKTIFPLAVLNETGKVLEAFKKQNNIVHISEFNSRISRIIMGEPVPFIYERLGERYHHILIDEFQDTSATQWKNFLPLIENSLASGYFNLVVGDGKQAIYRWRNGDVEQFASLPAVPGSDRDEVLRERERILKEHFEEVNLNRNYRSRAEIVSLNNRFFRKLTDTLFPEDKNSIYRDLEQEFDPSNTGGYARFEFLGPEEEKEQKYDEVTYERVLEIIHESLEAKFRLRDIAILCRSNDHASEIARFLLQNGIDVISAESLLLVNSPNVKFLTGFLRYLYLPANPVVMAEMAVFLSQDESGPRLIHENLRAISSEKSPEQGFRRFLAKIMPGIDLDELATMPLYDLCEALIRMFHLNRIADPYLQFFLDGVLKFTTKVSGGGGDFLAWWDQQKTKLSIIVPEGMDAVRVMTIHKAKGLQFPVVIYPFADEKRKMTKSYLWVDLKNNEVPGLGTAILRTDKDLAATPFADLFHLEEDKSLLDLVNVLYVAMTRAEERLYVLTKFPPEKSESFDSLPLFFNWFLSADGTKEEGKDIYTFGHKVDHVRQADADEVGLEHLSEFISSDWSEKIRVRMRSPERWNMEDPSAASLWGNRVHTLLSRVRTREDIGGVLEKGVMTGLIEVSELPRMREIMEEIVSHPLLGRLFSEKVKVKTEAEILVPGGAFYRPDRVVFDDGEVFIIDYKTGHQNERHRTQLNKYAAHLQEMGYEDITKVLVYLEPKLTVIKY